MGGLHSGRPQTADSLIDLAVRLVYSYIIDRYPSEDAAGIRGELKIIARDDRFDFSGDARVKKGRTYDQVQETLSRINERESIRRSRGVYYTPNDVVRFILTNAIKAAFGKLTAQNLCDMDLQNIPYLSFCCKKTVFDPTCGAGEYLLTALEMKLKLLKSHRRPSAALVRGTVSTIYGNDVNLASVIIAELRLLLCVAERCGVRYCSGLGGILNQRFTTLDFVDGTVPLQNRFHVIVGNPPYVEDAQSGLSPAKRYGNIYANVLLNAAGRLEKNGAMGFVVPLSYVATPRMRRLREELGALVPEQFILSFADRPDCLFDSVHQKLCIVIGKDRRVPLTLYTGNYRYWYREERPLLFQSMDVIRNVHHGGDFIPKLGTQTDVDIYKKVSDRHRTQSIYSRSREGGECVYLNRRETFWMKAYRTRVDDPEYKVFRFPTAREADFCYCVIHSSLFWWYWTCVSDCWHVSKTLNGFRMPHAPDMGPAPDLANALLKRLEATKVYVGTKQTQYEYKHRRCLDEIHAIDDFINSAYGLTASEGEYIKSFAIRYRTSGGVWADESN